MGFSGKAQYWYFDINHWEKRLFPQTSTANLTAIASGREPGRQSQARPFVGLGQGAHVLLLLVVVCHLSGLLSEDDVRMHFPAGGPAAGSGPGGVGVIGR